MGMQKAISHQPELASGSPKGSPGAGPKEFQRQSVLNPLGTTTPENPNFLSVSNVHKDTSKGDED